jgi:LysM repeat protein
VRDPGVYRRRRLTALFAASAAAYLLYAGAGAAQPPSDYHAVEPGDTLWRIATEHYPPAEDPREKVEEIRLQNELEGYEIYPGALLELPQGSQKEASKE